MSPPPHPPPAPETHRATAPEPPAPYIASAPETPEPHTATAPKPPAPSPTPSSAPETPEPYTATAPELTGPAGTEPPKPHRATASETPVRMVVVHLDALDADLCEPASTALEQFTPRVEVLRPGCYAFGARGPSRYFGGELALAELVAGAVSDAVSSVPAIGVGVADGLFAAGLAALLAARASDGPGAVVVPPQQARKFLADLPLSLLAEGISPLHDSAGAGKPNGGTAALHAPARRSGPRRDSGAGSPNGGTAALPAGTVPGDGKRPAAGKPNGGTAALLDVLWRLGMRTLGDVAALREADMLGRFGRPGLLAHRLACGLDDRPLQARAVPEDSGAEAEIDPPADRVETVAFAAKALADDMVARLARNGLDCVCIDIEAQSDTGHASSRRWRHEFRFSAAAVVDRVRWQLEGWYRSSERPTGPITLVRLTPCEVAPSDGQQLGMWGARRDTDERAAKALARVQGLLGAEAVTVPRLGGGRHPADTGRRVPLHTVTASSGPTPDPEASPTSDAASPAPGPEASPTSGTATKKRRTARTVAKKGETAAAPWPGRLPSPLPAVVLAKPEPVAVTDRSGAEVGVGSRGEVSAAPHQFAAPDGSRRVIAWAGPWPLDERWWHPTARRRQARFQMVLDDGSAHLCVVEAGRWWREATYD